MTKQIHVLYQSRVSRNDLLSEMKGFPPLISICCVTPRSPTLLQSRMCTPPPHCSGLRPAGEFLAHMCLCHSQTCPTWPAVFPLCPVCSLPGAGTLLRLNPTVLPTLFLRSNLSSRQLRLGGLSCGFNGLKFYWFMYLFVYFFEQRHSASVDL